MRTSSDSTIETRARWSVRLARIAAVATASLLCAPAADALAAHASASGDAPAAVTISPLPGAPDASPHTQISFLGVPASEISKVSVVGSRSGRHSGKLESYDSAPGASFLPSKGFVQGESVHVSAFVGPAGAQRHVSSSFTIARLFHYAFPPIKVHKVLPGAEVHSFVSAPSLHVPALGITQHSAKDTPGDIFFASNEGNAAWGPTIVDERGQLVWFHEVPPGDHAMDFKLAEYEGKPALVWWQGHIPPIGVGFGEDEVYNSRYQHIATIRAGNGLHADLHEVQIRPQGSALLSAYSIVKANDSSVGGYVEGGLLDGVMQEVDVKTGLVMFEWDSVGHVPIDWTYSKPISSHGWPLDYFHINSISMDPSGDGNFIISSRNTWAGYEINHVTGKIMWVLGGKHSSFKMGPGAQTAFQHDIEWQKDGTLTIFDNGGSPQIHKESRALREKIDFKTKTVKVVKIFDHGPAVLAQSQGNVQVLSDGNTFVGWGQAPYFSEFGPKGELLFGAHLLGHEKADSYRAYRFPWHATPSEAPAVAVQSGGDGAAAASGSATALDVYASWNGATDVASWRVLGGASESALAPIATARKTGFQSEIHVTTADKWIAAQALGPTGEVLSTSKAVES